MIILLNFKLAKALTMKRLLIFLFVLTELAVHGQAKIGMTSVLSFTPANATSPSSTVTYSTSVTFKAYVKNVGNVAFSGSLTILTKRDTLSGAVADSVSVGTSLQPNDSIPVIITFTPDPGPSGFKSGGNGNTIVVWPYIATGGAIPGDSVRAVIWVNDLNSVLELEKNPVILYPNPVSSQFHVMSTLSINFNKINIYDVFGRKVKELPSSDSVDVSELKTGTYWMIITTETKSYRVPFIKE
ncbi:MAG: T9SS type A sorting domain-containing protein [Bacteroidota bacterium]